MADPRRFGLLAALARARSGGGEPGHDAVELPAGASLRADLAYGADPAQRLDVYIPAGAAGAPVVLYLHGGGWRQGDKAMPRMVRHKVPHWLRRGWIAVSANYRLLPAADVLEQADDVARALAWVQAHAAGWGGDAAQLALVGHSAGAHLAALVTADAAFGSRHGAQPWRSSVVLDTAALDIEAVMTRAHFRFYDPVFGSDPAYWRRVSPMHRLQARPLASLLLVCSTLRDDSCAPAGAFAAKAQALGGLARVLPVALGHLEINDRLGVPGAYTDAVDAFLA